MTRPLKLSIYTALSILLSAALATACWGNDTGGSPGSTGPATTDDENEVRQRVGGEQERNDQVDDGAADKNPEASAEGVDKIGAEVEGPRLANYVFRRAHQVAGDDTVDTDVKIVEVEEPSSAEQSPQNDPPRLENLQRLNPETMEKLRDMSQNPDKYKQLNRRLREIEVPSEQSGNLP